MKSLLFSSLVSHVLSTSHHVYEHEEEDHILDDEETSCLLSQRTPEKPYPSLSFCFRNNVESCCLTAHDSMMADNYAAFMPPACLTNFVLFEQFQCLGCHPMQPKSVETFSAESKALYFAETRVADDGIVRLCRNFVESLYLEVTEGSEETTETRSTKYDGCGFLSPSNDSGVVIPSGQYTNVYEFLNDDKIKPAFFK